MQTTNTSEKYTACEQQEYRWNRNLKTNKQDKHTNSSTNNTRNNKQARYMGKYRLKRQEDQMQDIYKTSFIQHSSHSYAHKSKRSFTIPHIHPLKHDTLTHEENTRKVQIIHSLELNK